MPVNSTTTGTTYNIQKGDTLSEIAQQFGTTVEKLAADNNINNPNLIYAGATLKVEAGSGGNTGNPSQQANLQFAGDTGITANSVGGGSTPWMNVARQYMGQREYANGSNPFIEACHATTTLGSASDDVPWCSSFVNRVMEDAGYKGTDSALADSWAKWGADVGSLNNARQGDIVVIHDKSGNEHVGFLVRSGNGTITLLGGNQSNQVKESTFNLSSYNIYAIRRPTQSV